MIRVLVMYPNESGKKFDMDYYLNKHKPMVNNMIGDLGLVRGEVDKGIGGMGGSPAPFVAIGYMYFEDMDSLQKCMVKAQDMMADLPNFTDIQPQVQISEIA
ncbi:MAG TPA: EthD family reductase [Dehalococcoidia bacterium]|nr:EthD family reductase [Dehalococcoidia bacterium]